MRIFVDLKSSGKLKITLSKQLGKGLFERDELFIPENNIAVLRDTLNTVFPPSQPMAATPAAKTYTLDDIRKQLVMKVSPNNKVDFFDIYDEHFKDYFTNE